MIIRRCREYVERLLGEYMCATCHRLSFNRMYLRSKCARLQTMWVSCRRDVVAVDNDGTQAMVVK